MRLIRFSLIILLCIGCTHVPARNPSQSLDSIEIESFGNFFQKVKVKSSKELNFKSKLEGVLGRKLVADQNFLDLPDLKFNILNKNNWSVELPNLDIQYSSRYTNYILNIDIGELNEAQFNELKSIYKSSSDVIWQKSRKYSIVDFLPVSVQALYGNYYIHNRFTYDKKNLPWHYKFKDITNEGEVSRVTNCWHAAWEYLHGSQDKVSIFFADEQQVRSVFEDDSKSKVIKELRAAEVEAFYRSPQKVFADIKPGDLILIYQQMQSMAQGEFEALAHVAIAIDNNIIFEKMNPMSSLPYRLSFLTDSIDNLISIEKSNESDVTTEAHLQSLRVVVRRFENKLPNVRTLINMKLKPGIFLDINELKVKERPSDTFMQDHTILTEFGAGGTIISEDLYKIEDIPILKENGQYILKNEFKLP